MRRYGKASWLLDNPGSSLLHNSLCLTSLAGNRWLATGTQLSDLAQGNTAHYLWQQRQKYERR